MSYILTLICTILIYHYQNTPNLIYLSEELYLSNIGATDKPCGEWMSVAPMIV